jgi:hypothetical protein
MLRIRLFAFLLFAVLLSGCSAVRLAYNNADTALRWMADGYLDFEPPQADDFNARLAGFHAWHRSQELPQYAELLAGASDKLADGLTREELLWAWDNVNARMRAAARQAGPEMAVVLASLSAEQIVHLEKKFVETNEEFFKKQIKGGEPEQRKRRMKRNLEWIEDVFGDLSDAQEEQLRALSDALPLLYTLRLADRVRRQKEVVAMIRRERGAAEFAPRFVHWFSNWEEGRAPEYQRLTLAHREQYVEMLLDMDKGMTPKQREHAVKRLRKYAEDFRVLAEEGKPVRPGS